MSKKYILLSEKKWHDDLFDNLKNRINEDWVRIKSKEDFNLINLQNLNPSIIFIPHWSYIIEKKIYLNYECIVFHMTDLPFGRGGSPLQNLILRKIRETKISALRVSNGIDEGDIYLKVPLSLEGTAKQIFERTTPIIQCMISQIIDYKLLPSPQVGESVLFKRRKPDESCIENLNELDQVFDYIRMLDCEGYPRAFIEAVNLKFEFSNAKFDKDQNIINANVRIFKK